MGKIIANFKIEQLKKYIEEWNNIHKEISDSVKITQKTDNGFEAEIKDLDLSFFER